MARAARAVGAFAAAACAFAASVALAQSLPRVHVEKISLQPDRSVVAPGVPFHVRLHVHLKEPGIDVASLAILPDITNAQIIADERQTVSSASGSDFVEDLTLESDAPGVVTLANAHVDAIDPKTGKPFRYAAATVRVKVEGPTPADRAAEADMRRMLVTAAAWIGGVAAVLLVVLLAAALWLRRPRKPAPPPPAPASFPEIEHRPPPLQPYERVRLAAQTLANAPSRANAVALRTELFAVAGVSAGSTLRDALARTNDPALRRALASAERAAFAPEADLAVAIDAVVEAVAALPS
jgi:hypothetical protein